MQSWCGVDSNSKRSIKMKMKNVVHTAKRFHLEQVWQLFLAQVLNIRVKINFLVTHLLTWLKGSFQSTSIETLRIIWLEAVTFNSAIVGRQTCEHGMQNKWRFFKCKQAIEETLSNKVVYAKWGFFERSVWIFSKCSPMFTYVSALILPSQNSKSLIAVHEYQV